MVRKMLPKIGEKPQNIDDDIDIVEDIIGRKYQQPPRLVVCTPKRFEKIVKENAGDSI